MFYLKHALYKYEPALSLCCQYTNYPGFTVAHCLRITLTKQNYLQKKTFTSSGFSQEQDLLPPGPINKAVGANVLFVTFPSPQPIRAIRWHFSGSDMVTYTHPGPEKVNSSYTGRVLLNSSTGALELKGLTMADAGEYTLVLTYENGIGFQDHTLLQVFGK